MASRLFQLKHRRGSTRTRVRLLACWWVEQRDGHIFVVGKRKRGEAATSERAVEANPEKIVIVGGGAAGFAAAEMLRREQYAGSIVMLSDDEAPPADRPNLSKDFLAGKAPESWVPLRGRATIRKTRSISVSGRKRFAWSRAPARSYSPAATPSVMTDCCSRPVQSRYA